METHTNILMINCTKYEQKMLTRLAILNLSNFTATFLEFNGVKSAVTYNI